MPETKQDVTPLRIKIPRKTEVPRQANDITVPQDDRKLTPVLTAQINKKIIPDNKERYHEEDERSLKSLSNEDSDMYFYTNSGQSVSLRNFYRGQHAFMVLSGPSLNDYDLSLLNRRGVVTMGVNNSWTIFKPNLWVSVDDPGNFVDIGWKDPSITKFAPVGHYHKFLIAKEADGRFRPSQFKVRDMPGVFYFRRNCLFRPKTFLTENTVNWGCDDDVTDELGCKGGRSVMLAGLKILHYLGFRNVYLLGADFRMDNGKQNYAFRQDRSESSVKGNNNTYESLNKRFTSMLPEFNASGFKVYNCFKKSGLQSFPFISYEKAIEDASQRFIKPIDTEGWYDRKEREKEALKETKEKDTNE